MVDSDKPTMAYFYEAMDRACLPLGLGVTKEIMSRGPRVEDMEC
jgi:hypothetical protein